MDNVITLQMLLDLPKIINEEAQMLDGLSNLLSLEYCNEFYFKGIRTKMDKLLSKFKDLRYSFDNQTVNSHIISKYGIQPIIKNISNPTAKIAEKNCEDYLWEVELFNRLVQLGNKLTVQEALYFNATFFQNRNEFSICDELRISQGSLIPIKRSCLVKAWLDLQEFVEDD